MKSHTIYAVQMLNYAATAVVHAEYDQEPADPPRQSSC